MYANSDSELLAFIKNPVKHIQYIKNHVGNTTRTTKLLIKLPFFRKYIHSTDVMTLFEVFLIKLAEDAEKEMQQLPPKIVGFAEELKSVCIEELRSYFNISSGAINYIGPLWKMHNEDRYGAKMGYHSNRIMEVCNLSEGNMLSIVKSSSLWSLFFLSEMYFLIKNKYMVLSMDSHGFIIDKSFDMEKQSPSYWVSEMSEFHARISDALVIKNFSESIAHLDYISPSQLSGIIDYFLDKAYSIHVGYLNSDIRKSPLYNLMRDAVGFALLIEVKCHNQPRRIEKQWINKQRLFMDENLEYMNSIINENTDSRFGTASAFIAAESIYYKRGDLFFKHGLKKFIGKILHEYKGKDRNFAGTYGKIPFEKEYILSYINKIVQCKACGL